MHIFFDVYSTILEPATHTLRPKTKEVIDRLRKDGHFVYLWSNMINLVGHVTPHVEFDGVFSKPYSTSPKALEESGIHFLPEFCIDDKDEYLIEGFGGYLIKPYYLPNDKDREMYVVSQKIRSVK